MPNSNYASFWQLHVRSVKGEPLTQEEKGQLQAWYDAQDQIELRHLRIVHSVSTPTAQIKDILGHIEASIQNIKQLTAEHEVLRQDATEFRRQLAKQRSFQLV